MIIAAIVALAVLLITIGLLVAGVFDQTPGQGSSDPAADPRLERTAEPTTAAPEEIPGKTIGTPDNPYSPGDSFTYEGWTFTVGTTDTDAWPELAPTFERDVPDIIGDFQPAPGMVFVAVPVSMTYTGSPEAQSRANSHGVWHIAADGTESMEGTCGRYGIAVDTYKPGYSSEPTAEGISCVEIPPAQVAGGLWRVHLDFVDDSFVEVYYTAE